MIRPIVELPIDDEIADVLAGDIPEEAIRELWARDSRRTLYGLLRQAARLTAELASDEAYIAMLKAEVERKNAGKQRSLDFLEIEIGRLAEQLLPKDSKHLDVPGVGRVQYRDFKPSLRIEDPDAFMAALGPDERARLIEQRPHLKTTDAKKYAETVLTESGEVIAGVERVPERRTASIEYEAPL